MKDADHSWQEQSPLVSVILPVRNREASIARAINSVLAQTYSHLELIVIDDGSTDGTRRVVESFGPQVKLISQSQQGVYPARNAGLRESSGELVAFIDSDDAWLPNRLAAQVPLMIRPEVGLVFGDVIHVTAPRSGAVPTGQTSFQISPPGRGRVADRFASFNFVPTVTVVVRRSCLQAIGGFSEETDVSADYLAWLRIALSHELDYVDRPVATYTVHADGISYDLGKSLAARIKLFSAERARTTDPLVAALLARLLFNLSLHLIAAGMRGRARRVPNPLGLALSTARTTASLEAFPLIAAFVLRRVRRLFS